MWPSVDVNLFVHNGAVTVGPAIESVLAQTWPALHLTLIDDGSTDGTTAILADYAARQAGITLKRNRHNAGAIPNFQRAFWTGDADFVMPKSGDDLIAPDFIARAMDVLMAHPGCAMVHAGGLIVRGEAEIVARYPPEHNLLAIGPDPRARIGAVMASYTSSPSFWGVYRRAASDALSPIRYRAGWDHVLLAELALYGEIRHVEAPLYWRRDGGKPVANLARAATAQACARLTLDDDLAEQRWRAPLITTAYAHMEMLAASRLAGTNRLCLMDDVAPIFRARWLPYLRQEAEAVHAALPDLLRRLRETSPMEAAWLAGGLADLIRSVIALVPEIPLHWAQAEIAAGSGEYVA